MGYLPQVDDMLGVHPGSDQGPPSGDGSGGTALQRSALGASEDDPFAASSHALQMKADSVAAGAEQQTQPRGGSPPQRGESKRSCSCVSCHPINCHVWRSSTSLQKQASIS